MTPTDAPTPARQRRWLSSRVANSVRYSLLNIFFLVSISAIALGGIFTWTGHILSFVLIGFVDELFGDAEDGENMPPRWYMQAMLYLTLPLLVAGTLICFNVTSEAGFPWIDAILRPLGFDPAAARANTEFFSSAGAFVSLGMLYGAAGVNVAHELVHRIGRPVDQAIGRWMLAFTWDTGFAIEHVHGHHRYACTEQDPAPARRGEYILAFVFRSAIGQWQSARRIETERLARKGIPNRPWTNRFWRGQLMSAAILAAYIAFLGPIGLVLNLFAAAIGKNYLELVNYIEHYGLVRVPGSRMEARHSWDSYRRLSTGMLYNLPLHSHHHISATTPFWSLKQSGSAAPMLPMGYMPMILMALFMPKYWFPYSDRLLAQWDRTHATSDELAHLRARGLLRAEEL